MLTGFLATCLEVWAGVALFFSGLLVLGVLRLPRKAPPEPTVWPNIAILRPCEGQEPALFENLCSSFSGRYPGERRVLLLCPNASDPAYETLQRVKQAAPKDIAIDIVLTRPEERQNRKVAQLEAGLAHVHEEIVVTADSDVHLSGEDLTRLVATLCAKRTEQDKAPRIGAVFAAPVEQTPVTPWDRLSCAVVGASTQNFMALYGLYRWIGGVPSMSGALVAFSKQALEDIGGLAQVRAILGEDYELARQLCAAGYSVELGPLPARCSDGNRSLGGVVSRVARWIQVVRAQRPLLLPCYPLFIAATPPLLVGLAIFRTPLLAILCAGVFSLRTLLAWLLRRRQQVRQGFVTSALEVLLAETLLMSGFVSALLTRKITWRGYRFRIQRGGTMVPS
jgi:ceramide glucosyltransferase